MVMIKSHNPRKCEVQDCRSCAMWWDGREIGFTEASLSFLFYSRSEHSAKGHFCDICGTVADLRSLMDHDFKGYPTGSTPKMRLEQLVISRYMGGEQEQEPVKVKVQVRTTPRVRVRLERLGVM